MKKASTALVAALVSLALAGPAQADLNAVTQPATAVTDTSAVLGGKVDPSGSLPSYYFEYGPTEAYGNQTPAIPFTTQMQVKVALVGLSPGTVYHFRVVAKRDDRSARGADQRFTTLGGTGLPTLPDPGITDPITNPVTSNTSSGSGQGGSKPDDPNATDPSSSGDDGQGEDGPVAVVEAGDSSRPDLGSTVGAAPQSGSIEVQAPGADSFAPLPDGAPIPVGSTVDARHGSVNIVTAVGGAGAVQTATFRGAIFEVRQSRSAGGLTDIWLRGGDFSTCPTKGRIRATRALARRSFVHAAKRRRAVRKLWGRDHHGRFRTHGRGAIATVRGTTWIVADHCDGTRTSVLAGAVSVRDKRRHRTVLVRAGHSYFARTSR